MENSSVRAWRVVGPVAGEVNNLGVTGWTRAKNRSLFVRERESDMYGLIGRMIAVEGRREELLAILKESVGDYMPGCHSYIVARCKEHPEGVWVTEVWDNPESHKASLDLQQVRDAIAAAKPLIAGFDNRFETDPVAGIGL